MFRFFFLSALLFFIGYWVFSYFARAFGGNRQNQRSNQRYSNAQEPEEDKHFSKDIGEYVTYEEVKDDEKKE